MKATFSMKKFIVVTLILTFAVLNRTSADEFYQFQKKWPVHLNKFSISSFGCQKVKQKLSVSLMSGESISFR